jgi:hypothetical protein
LTGKYFWQKSLLLIIGDTVRHKLLGKLICNLSLFPLLGLGWISLNLAWAFFLNFDEIEIEIETVQLDEGVYVLMGGPSQGNVLVSVGEWHFYGGLHVCADA